MSAFYVAILEANKAGEIFATVPDLPGVNACGGTRAEALALAIEFANDYVRDLADGGHAIPQARTIDAIEADPEAPELGRALIPVELPGRSVKISLSIDEALLKRADRAAIAEGQTRSGYVADALNARLGARASSVLASSASSAGASTARARRGFSEEGLQFVPIDTPQGVMLALKSLGVLPRSEPDRQTRRRRPRKV